MYKVFFNSEEFARMASLEDALALALNLHRASNIKHTVDVYGLDSDQVEITLIRDR